MKAIILAAGAGTRLRPLTDTCPKPMLPIAGRPLLARTLDWLQEYGVREVALNLHHLPAIIQQGLGDGSAWGMRLHYSYEPTLLGTAGAVLAIAEQLPGWLDETFLLVYGDMLLQIELDSLVQLHQRQHAVLTLALKETTVTHTQGMVEVDKDGRILQFVEKPSSWNKGNLANAGLYLCEPSILNYIRPGISDFGYDVIPTLIKSNEPVYGQRVAGTLLDIGTPAAYAQAHQVVRQYASHQE